LSKIQTILEKRKKSKEKISKSKEKIKKSKEKISKSKEKKPPRNRVAFCVLFK
jgi:peptidoglycan hydrolase CwlO-like protein